MSAACNRNRVFRNKKLWQESTKIKLFHKSPTNLKIMAVLCSGRDAKIPTQTYLSARAQGQDIENGQNNQMTTILPAPKTHHRKKLRAVKYSV